MQKRLQELRLAGITVDEANRFLKEVYLPQHNARFATPAKDQGTAFVPFAGADARNTLRSNDSAISSSC